MIYWKWLEREFAPDAKRPIAVVMDEAQEASIDDWVYVEAMMGKDAKSKLMVVFDENQRIKKAGEFYIPDNLAMARLSRVIRNTQEIGNVTLKFYRGGGDSIEIAGPQGPAVRWLVDDGRCQLTETIVSLVLQLTKEDGFSYEDIVVLVPGGGARRIELDDRTESRGVSLRAMTDNWGGAKKHPFVSYGNVAGFRGMESSVVILAGLDRALDGDLLEACYVGASRAKALLCLVGSSETFERIHALEGSSPGSRQSP